MGGRDGPQARLDRNRQANDGLAPQHGAADAFSQPHRRLASFIGATKVGGDISFTEGFALHVRRNCYFSLEHQGIQVDGSFVKFQPEGRPLCFGEGAFLPACPSAAPAAQQRHSPRRATLKKLIRLIRQGILTFLSHPGPSSTFGSAAALRADRSQAICESGGGSYLIWAASRGLRHSVARWPHLPLGMREGTKPAPPLLWSAVTPKIVTSSPNSTVSLSPTPLTVHLRRQRKSEIVRSNHNGTLGTFDL
mmetsp:Transcript_41507/g.93790  ORF Transcript_41507/g.93790 Transcript_41507/m.93790 type:complete len:250 (-) Transcript_41507:106-855(-)